VKRKRNKARAAARSRFHGGPIYFDESARVWMCPRCLRGMTLEKPRPGDVWLCCDRREPDFMASRPHGTATITCVDRERGVISIDGGER